MRRKVEIVGTADPSLAATALGILYAHDQIEQSHFDAGILYTIVRARAGFSRPFAATSRYEEWVYAHLSSDAVTPSDIKDEGAARERYEMVDAALRNAGSLARTETFNVAVEDRLPSWFTRRSSLSIKPSDERCRHALLLGLSALAAVFGTA